ncbi:hypothetical protein ACFVYF_27060 [Streptomyces sp. NPDC058274]|uniref:hypothetical protein n=1 Tax=Streptomyces sp. NPDC058274 TaxID=3346416 RepID=UPI0036E9DB59
MTEQTEQQAPDSIERAEQQTPDSTAPAPAPVPADVQSALPAPPPMPEAPPAAPPVKKDRRVLRAVLRWSAAVVVFAAVGTSAAYGITRMERTDVPGLQTQADGRWDYPEIVRPPLPAGRPGPFAEGNAAGAHYADLRELVLPAPEGARADKGLRGTDGWLAKKDFLAAYGARNDRETLGQLLTDYGLRHIAARGWTTQDGTHTSVYLLQFDTAAVVDELEAEEIASYDSPEYPLRGAAEAHLDEHFPAEAQLDDVHHTAYDEARPYGAAQVRQAYVTAGDTLALIVQSRKGSTQAVPFQQTVVLQSQLLG